MSMPWEDFKSASNTMASGPWDDFKSPASSSEGSSQMDVAKFAAGQVSNLAPWNKLTKMRQKFGGDIAEAGGYVGGKVANAGFPNAGNVIQGAGVELGAIPAIGPEALSAYTSLKGLYNPENPVAAGLTKTPQQLSPQYTAQNDAAGIANRPAEQAGKIQYPDQYQYPSQLSKPKYIPVKPSELPAGQPGVPMPEPVQPATPTFRPVENPNAPAFSRPKPQIPAEPLPTTTPLKYPSDPASLVNTAGDRITKFGDKLGPQELHDYRNLLDQNIGHPNKIPQFIQGKLNPLYAQASALRSQVNGLLNQVVDKYISQVKLPTGTLPTRESLNQAYGISKIPGKVGSALGDVSKTGGKIAGAGAGIYGTIQALKHYFGN